MYFAFFNQNLIKSVNDYSVFIGLKDHHDLKFSALKSRL